METIKDYLVSLGFEADEEAYRKFTQALAKAANEVDNHTSFMSNKYVKTAAAISGAIGSIVSSTAVLLNSLSQADLGYQVYAMRMYMATDAAKQFNIVTKSMGRSLDEIAWIKELNQQYRMLMTDASRMELPTNYRDQMEFVRSIRFEMVRLKVEAIYGLQWIGYEFMKNMLDPLGKTKMKLSDVNDYIIDHMPKIAKKVADFMTEVWHLLVNISRPLQAVGTGLKEFWNALGDSGKLLAFSTALGLLALHPLGRMVLLLAGLPLLIDEFYVAMEGGQTRIPVIFYQGLAIAIDGVARSMMFVIALGTAFWAALKGTKAEKDIVRLKIESAESEKRLQGYSEAKNKLLSLQRQRKLDVKETRDLATYTALEEKEAEIYNQKVKELNDTIDIAKQSRLTVAEMKQMSFDIFNPKSPTGIRPFYEGTNLGWSDAQREAHYKKATEAMNTVVPTDINELINSAATAHNINPNVFRELIRQESNFNPKATSEAGAQGIMQLMPSTAKAIGVKNPFDVEESIYGGAKHLSDLLKTYHGDYSLALAAYNAGEPAVNKYGRNIPPYAETQKYVGDIMRRSGMTVNINHNVTITGSKPDAMPIANALKKELAIQNALIMGYGAGIR